MQVLETKPELANYTFFNSHYNVMHHAAGALGWPVPPTYPVNASFMAAQSVPLHEYLFTYIQCTKPGTVSALAGTDASTHIALETLACCEVHAEAMRSRSTCAVGGGSMPMAGIAAHSSQAAVDAARGVTRWAGMVNICMRTINAGPAPRREGEGQVTSSREEMEHD